MDVLTAAAQADMPCTGSSQLLARNAVSSCSCFCWTDRCAATSIHFAPVASPHTHRYLPTAVRFQNHPDKGGDPDKFKEISMAYDVLSDPQKRKVRARTRRSRAQRCRFSHGHYSAHLQHMPASLA
jgi:DnaJ domain